MKRATPITCLFWDIGGVLLTDGWDHRARTRIQQGGLGGLDTLVFAGGFGENA